MTNFSEAEEYQKFKALTPILIHGLMRCGTTLLLRLFDGHPQLLVYPFEDDIFRNFFQTKDTDERKITFCQKIAMRDAAGIFSSVSNFFKSGLALRPQIEDRGRPLMESKLALGAAKALVTKVDPRLFQKCFTEALSSVPETWSLGDIFRVWVFSYFRASGVENMSCYAGWVTKKAGYDQGLEFYLKIPHSKIIQITRDPRAVYASVKQRRLDKNAPAFCLFATSLIAYKLTHRKVKTSLRLAPDSFVKIRYEDLVNHTKEVMLKLSSYLRIAYDDILTRPTFVGRAWLSNSSFKIAEERDGKIFSESRNRWRSVLGWHERAILNIVLAKEISEFKETPEM